MEEGIGDIRTTLDKRTFRNLIKEVEGEKYRRSERVISTGSEDRENQGEHAEEGKEETGVRKREEPQGRWDERNRERAAESPAPGQKRP